jgi:hypothetical protein
MPNLSDYNPPQFVLDAAKSAMERVECNQYSPSKVFQSLVEPSLPDKFTDQIFCAEGPPKIKAGTRCYLLSLVRERP